jgi:hypothetical protein
MPDQSSKDGHDWGDEDECSHRKEHWKQKHTSLTFTEIFVAHIMKHL